MKQETLIPYPLGFTNAPYPFAMYGEGTNTVQECCKCQYQTKCQASSGANYYNYGAALAMMADDGAIDQSEFSYLISKFYYDPRWPDVWS